MIIVITKNITFNPIITAIPNKLIKKWFNFLKNVLRILMRHTEKRYKSWGSNKDLINVTLPIRDKFLCFQQLRVCSICLNLGTKLRSYRELTFKEKLIPKVLNVLDLHLKPESWNGKTSLFLKLPIWITLDLDILILQPEKEANWSRVLKRVWKYFRPPCKKQVVTSANKLIFFFPCCPLESLWYHHCCGLQ